jgi:hypothetical protein
MSCFVGLLPAAARGTHLPGPIHIIDFYATFAVLGGAAVADPTGPTAVEGMNMWPYLTGAVSASASPRADVVYDHRPGHVVLSRGPYVSLAA